MTRNTAILLALVAKAQSPTEYAEVRNIPRNNVSQHFSRLYRAGFIEPVGMQKHSPGTGRPRKVYGITPAGREHARVAS